MIRTLMMALIGIIATISASFADDIPNLPEDFLAHPDGSFLLQNVRILDGTSDAALEGVHILISDGKIEAIGQRISVPDDATVINLEGHTVLPGLIHLHDHFGYMSSPFRGYDFIILDPHPFSIPKLQLSVGVTTIRTAGSDAVIMDGQLAKMIDAGMAVGPRTFVTSSILEGPDVPILLYAETAEEGRALVRSQLPFNVSSIKVYAGMGHEAMQAVIDEAHKHGLHVAGHLGEVSCAEASEMGIDTIEHALESCSSDFPSRTDRENPFRLSEHLGEVESLIRTLIKNGTVLVTTPSGGRRANHSEEARSVFAIEQRAAFEKIGVEEGNRSESGNPQYVLSQKDEARKFERRFRDAGGRLLMGADAMYLPIIPGYSNQDIMVELADWHDPFDVIRMATSDAADFLGIGGETGRIAEGFTADLLIVEGAPDLDMTDIRRTKLVFQGGRAYDPVLLRAATVGRVGLD